MQRTVTLLSALLLISRAAAAQDDAWVALVEAADSIGPETPPIRIAPDVLCTEGVARADSVELRGPGREFLLAARSTRTRGMWSYSEIPEAGAGRFALREVRCDEEDGRPYTFVMERDHRYFYLIASLVRHPSYEALRFRSAGGWQAFRWFPESREFRIDSRGEPTVSVESASAKAPGI